MSCSWYAEFEGVCTNGMCPYRADICPVIENQEVCIFSNVTSKETDLDMKCGSCKYGEPHVPDVGRGHSYVRCLHPKRASKPDYQNVKQRTDKACLRYERKEDAK